MYENSKRKRRKRGGGGGVTVDSDKVAGKSVNPCCI